MASINHYTDFVKASNISTSTGVVIIGDDGGYSEYILWAYSSKSSKAKCVILPEANSKHINIQEFNKEIPDVGLSFSNLKDTFGLAIENRIECFTRDNIEKLSKSISDQLQDQEIMIFMGAKKVKFLNDMNQEKEYMKYMLVYVIIGLKLLYKGGSLILRTYDLNIPFSCDLLFILYKHFDNLTIMQPLASNLHSAVNYYYYFIGKICCCK